MRFLDATNTFDSLVHHTRFLLNHADDVPYPTAEKARAANIWVGKIMGWIFETETGWELDDPEFTVTDTLAKTQNLTAGTQNYVPTAALTTLPSGAPSSTLRNYLQIIGVSVLDNGGIWHKLTQVDWQKIKVDRAEYFKTNGLPIHFDLWGNVISLFPAPAAANVTVTDGLKIFFRRTQDIFIPTDTSQEPPFISNYHSAVSYGMAYEYANAKGLGTAGRFLTNLYGGIIEGTRIDGYKKDIQDFYARRNLSKKVRIEPDSMTSFFAKAI